MKNFHIAEKILPDYCNALQLIQDATGQTQSEVLREEIALYLGLEFNSTPCRDT